MPLFDIPQKDYSHVSMGQAVLVDGLTDGSVVSMRQKTGSFVGPPTKPVQVTTNIDNSTNVFVILI